MALRPAQGGVSHFGICPWRARTGVLQGLSLDEDMGIAISARLHMGKACAGEKLFASVKDLSNPGDR